MNLLTLVVLLNFSQVSNDKIILEDCTVTSSASSTVTAQCSDGGTVSATFTQSCTETASTCEEATILSSACATVKASRMARQNAPAVATLCQTGGSGGDQP